MFACLAVIAALCSQAGAYPTDWIATSYNTACDTLPVKGQDVGPKAHHNMADLEAADPGLTFTFMDGTTVVSPQKAWTPGKVYAVKTTYTIAVNTLIQVAAAKRGTDVGLLSVSNAALTGTDTSGKKYGVACPSSAVPTSGKAAFMKIEAAPAQSFTVEWTAPLACQNVTFQASVASTQADYFRQAQVTWNGDCNAPAVITSPSPPMAAPAAPITSGALAVSFGALATISFALLSLFELFV